MSEQAKVAQCCGTCKYAKFPTMKSNPERIEPSSTARCTWRPKGGFPDSMLALSGWMSPKDGVTCPCWQPREQEGSVSLDRILAEQRRAAAYLAEHGPGGAALGVSDWTHEEVERRKAMPTLFDLAEGA